MTALRRSLPRTLALRAPVPLSTRSLHISRALHADLEPPHYLSPAETTIFRKLQTSLAPSKLDVQDISGGCGSMYGLDIESERFRGLSVIKQHKMVNEVLKEEIAGWHGVQLKTRAPTGE